MPAPDPFCAAEGTCKQNLSLVVAHQQDSDRPMPAIKEVIDEVLLPG